MSPKNYTFQDCSGLAAVARAIECSAMANASADDAEGYEATARDCLDGTKEFYGVVLTAAERALIAKMLGL